MPKGPLMNSEFYPGWLAHWGEKFPIVDTKSVVETLKDMLKIGASVNFYVFFGGTNFAFTAGNHSLIYLKQYIFDIIMYCVKLPTSS